MRGGESRDLQKQSPDIYLRIWKSDIKWKWPPNVTLTFSFKIRVQHTRTISLTLQWRKQLRGTLSYCIIFFGPFEKRLIPKFVVIAHVSFHTLHIAMKTLEIFFMGRMDRDKPHISILNSSSRRVTPPARIPLWVLFLVDDEHFRFGPAVRSPQYISTWKVYNLLVLGAEIKTPVICARTISIATSYIVWRWEAKHNSVNFGTQIRKTFGSVLQFSPHITMAKLFLTFKVAKLTVFDLSYIVWSHMKKQLS